MTAELLISVADGEARAARIEDGVLVDLVIERSARVSLVGNIYLGRVRRLLPGLAAAFVDIGLERDGFLPLSTDRSADATEDRVSATLAEGETICVQVVRDASRSKGLQLSRRLSIAGGRLVFVPGSARVAVSRLIDDESERTRLAAVVQALCRDGDGFVVRTAAESVGEEELTRESELLRAYWSGLVETRRAADPPSLVHAEPDIVERIIRDHGLSDLNHIRVEGAAAFARARAFCRRFAPEVEPRLMLHRCASSLFETYGIATEVDEVLTPRVALPSGGSIIIETTEALTAIDVNSGSMAGPDGPDEAALKANLEAASEIVRQIRVRNLAGLIVLDFISMMEEEAWRQVLEALADGLARDRTSSRLLGRTAAGLVEITRRRQRVSLAEALTEPCAACDGHGRVPTAETVAHATVRRLRREARVSPPGALVVTAGPDVVAAIEAICANGLSGLEVEVGRRIVLEALAGGPRGAVDLHIA